MPHHQRHPHLDPCYRRKNRRGQGIDTYYAAGLSPMEEARLAHNEARFAAIEEADRLIASITNVIKPLDPLASGCPVIVRPTPISTT